MPYGTTVDTTGDFEKLQKALQDVTAVFGSVDSILEAFGLTNMPSAQRYGILFGCIVFITTVSTVLALLVLGGSFKRIAEQSKTGKPTLLTSTEVRKERPLLLETLLEGRERLQNNYPPPSLTDQPTCLAQMLLNVAPDPVDDDDDHDKDDDNNKQKEGERNQQQQKQEKKSTKERNIPPHYEENYISAYRKCQDQPGGKVLSGRPEARFEAYARGFAGCGPYTSLAYRRSYARMYESICCTDHKSDDKYNELFEKRPYDIIGRFVRLEVMSPDRHLNEFFKLTDGSPRFDKKAYDPLEVWGFQPEGPFQTPIDMHKSFVFQRKVNEAGFAMIHNVTEKIVGVVLLTNDTPEHLSIQIEPPIMPPNSQGTQQQLEACFLLLDRLFAYGYRRIQMAVDSQDPDSNKLANRLGFTYEGVLLRHMVLKNASRDSNMYGLLNSDWKKGARAVLFGKLYGEAALKIDQSNEHREAEKDEQTKQLAEQKKNEASESKKHK